MSPYLDLTRGNPTFQYFRRIRPENELRSGLAQQGAAIESLQSTTAKAEQSKTGASPTGHPTQFLNLSHFYNLKAPGR